MDANELENVLLRLSLDGSGSERVSGMTGFPVLLVDGVTVFAQPKTVLSKIGIEKFAPRPGLSYVGIGPDGGPAAAIAGRSLFPGRSETTLDRFIEKYGDLFDRNEIEIETPDDPFSAYLRSA